MNLKILQIMPSDGWWAEFSLVNKGKRHRYRNRLIGWALVQDEEEPESPPFVTGLDAQGNSFVEACDNDADFQEYCHPDGQVNISVRPIIPTTKTK